MKVFAIYGQSGKQRGWFPEFPAHREIKHLRLKVHKAKDVTNQGVLARAKRMQSQHNVRRVLLIAYTS